MTQPSQEPRDEPAEEIARLRAECAGYKAAYEQVASELVGYKGAYEKASSEAVGYRSAYERACWLYEQQKAFLEDSRPLPRPHPQVGFLHIMKTAGSSVLGFFQPKFEELRTLWLWYPAELDAYTARQVASYDFITGHFSHSGTRKFRHDRLLFTFLRHPVARVLSSYWFFRSFPGEARVGVNDRLLAAAKKYDLLDFLRCDDPQVRSNNIDHQTHALAGDYRVGWRAPDADALSLALAHLDEYAVVGLTERSEESTALICRRMGWEYRPLERLNVTPKRQGLQDLSTAERAALEERNQLDLQLYEAARRRLDRDLEPEGQAAA